MKAGKVGLELLCTVASAVLLVRRGEVVLQWASLAWLSTLNQGVKLDDLLSPFQPEPLYESLTSRRG